MYDSSKQISDFQKSEVALPKQERDAMRARRDANRKRLRSGLADAAEPTPIGLHTQGSYSMRTMIQDPEMDYDIDDGVYFEKDDLLGPAGGEYSALETRKKVCAALQDEKFNKQPEVMKNCVRVYYNEGYHVDVPAYRKITQHNTWSGSTDDVYELASADWKQSDPRAVTRWFNQRNLDLSPDSRVSNGQLRRVVRLLKKFSKSRSSWKDRNATGFMITKLAVDVYRPELGRDDASLRNTMIAIRDQLTLNLNISHPKLDEFINKDSDPRPAFFMEKITENLEHLSVLDHADCTHADAMSAWDRVFNTDWFSGQPEPQRSETNSAPKAAVVKEGGGRYASADRSL